MENKIFNLTKKDLFNANGGEGFKEAGNSGKTGKLQGYGTYLADTEEVTEDGVIVKKTVSVMKVDNVLYAGDSIVIEKRLRQLADFMDMKDLEKGIDIVFKEIKAGRGTAVSFDLL